MPKPRKPEPAFEVVFEGSEIYPEKIPLGTLNQVLSAIRRLATASEPVEEDTESEAGCDESAVDEGRISLLDVKRGSTVLQFACPDNVSAIDNLREAGRALKDPEKVAHRDYVLNPIRRLSAVAKFLRCTIVVRQPVNDGMLATIESSSYQQISESLFISGETTFTGIVERAGGATSMRCSLRVPFQPSLLYCSVANSDLVRQLGDCLYQNVTVQGLAKWIRNTWRVMSFEIRNVSRFEPNQSLGNAFQALRDAGGNGWDKIEDPQSFLEGISGK